MSFPRYQSYKDSGVGWLGDVPTHWQPRRLRQIATFSGGGTPSRENLAFWNGAIPWVSPKDMKSEKIFETEECITESGLQSSATNMVPIGAALIVVRSGILKHTIPVAINRVPVALNQDMKAVRFPKSDCSPKFFQRWVQGLNDHLLLAWSKQGATVESIEQSYLADTVIPLPPLSEQSKIVAFLDRETAKINTLVEEQRRLTELLKEKRQAIISQAITRGLHPNVPMNSSGLEWLGDLPQHWQLKRLKKISPFIAVGIVVNPSDYISDEGLPFIYGGDISEGRIDTEGCRRISSDDSIRNAKTRLLAGDLLTIRVGAPGVTAVVPASCEGGNCASVMLIRRGNFCSPWLCYAMNSQALRYQVELVQYGAAQEQFNISHAVNFFVPTPSRDEQSEIAAYLDLEVGKIDALVSGASEATALLEERRSALISAAVTGKIDVRGLVEADALAPDVVAA
jgi:type I restriction enzyme S subunit